MSNSVYPTGEELKNVRISGMLLPAAGFARRFSRPDQRIVEQLEMPQLVKRNRRSKT